MVEGDKLLEDFVSITVLAKGDAIEYLVPTVSSVVTFLSHSSSILVQSCSAISEGTHDLKMCISRSYALDNGEGQGWLHVYIKHDWWGFLTLETI